MSQENRNEDSPQNQNTKQDNQNIQMQVSPKESIDQNQKKNIQDDVSASTIIQKQQNNTNTDVDKGLSDTLNKFMQQNDKNDIKQPLIPQQQKNQAGLSSDDNKYLDGNVADDEQYQQQYLEQQQDDENRKKNASTMSNPFQEQEINGQPQNFCKVLLKTTYISLPNVASFVSLWILNFINCKFTEFYGNEDNISAYALSFMWANALGFALILCLNTGLCAMASQAIGLRHYKLVSNFYQRSQVLNYLLMIVMTIVMLFTKQIFSLFTEKSIADLSQQFMNGYIPALFTYIIFDSTRNIFNAYKKFQIPNLLLLFTYSLHAVWVYLLMGKLHQGMFGLGLSRTITETINAVILIAIIHYKKLFKDVQFKWSKHAFKKWKQYLKLSIPMGSVLYLDWVASDIQTLFVAAYKNQDQLAGHSAFVSIFLLYVIFPLGVSITIMTFIGSAIGKGDIIQCKKIAKVAFVLSICITVITSVISLSIEDWTADLFTTTPGEKINFLKCYRIFVIFTIQGNGITMVIGSILRAGGLQNAAFIIPLISYFIIGVPLQWFLVFYLNWGVTGSWIAYTTSVYITSICFLIRVFNIDWEKQIQVVKTNVQNQIDSVIQDDTTSSSEDKL